MIYHQPVLLNEAIEGLNIRPGGIYVDATFGGGGHSREILKKLGNGRLVAFDQDAEAEKNAGKIDDPRFLFVRQNFRFLKNNLRFHEAIPVNGILADLGVSSHQFDTAERGFSYRYNAELDMRMNRSGELMAKHIVNRYSEEELKRVFRDYGEIENSARLAAEIIKARDRRKVDTVKEFLEVIDGCVFKNKEQQYLSRVFQALRIEVNDEIRMLREFLKQSFNVLEKGGRLVVISYHSLEDRLVKHFMKTGNFEGNIEKDFFGNVKKQMRVINNKVITPSEEEIRNNARARSAKLRIAEKE
jgi:16S rRNA (cytosine1402-N4)-methyltransferase